MPTLTLKGLPDGLYERLKQSAAENRRSINSEIIIRLERSLTLRRVDPERFLVRADALREKLALKPLTDEDLRAAKAYGRP